jgi:phosphonate transport system substrate-binding protein
MRKALYLFLLIFIGFGKSALASDKTYTVAVVPQFSSNKIYADWTPLLAKLEVVTGLHFQLIVYNDFSRFEKEFESGIPDLIFFNPYHMTVAKKMQGYRPLLRDAENLSGILVVQKDSPISQLADLNGKTIAFPSPNALGASLYMRALLAEKFHLKINPVYVNGHQNVYRHVIHGEASAGGGVARTLASEDASVQNQLKIIFSTPEIASHPLAAHPRIPIETSKKIVRAMLALAKDPVTSKLLTAVQLPQPIEADYKRDYAGLAKLKLDRYTTNQIQQ